MRRRRRKKTTLNRNATATCDGFYGYYWRRCCAGTRRAKWRRRGSSRRWQRQFGNELRGGIIIWMNMSHWHRYRPGTTEELLHWCLTMIILQCSGNMSHGSSVHYSHLQFPFAFFRAMIYQFFFVGLFMATGVFLADQGGQRINGWRTVCGVGIWFNWMRPSHEVLETGNSEYPENFDGGDSSVDLVAGMGQWRWFYNIYGIVWVLIRT